MTFRACGALLAMAAGMTLAVPASAQRKPTIAIMPTGYFAADAASAENVTRALAEQYERQGYTVVSADRTASAAQGISQTMHHPDSTAVRFGRAAGADLVAYPRLLALGIPAANNSTAGTLLEPNAVLHLRVINVHSGQNIYFRQIAHEYRADRPLASRDFNLPQPIASSTAGEVSSMYFERVAGSRQEFRGMR